jgi:hypothetical protein
MWLAGGSERRWPAKNPHERSAREVSQMSSNWTTSFRTVTLKPLEKAVLELGQVLEGHIIVSIVAETK